MTTNTFRVIRNFVNDLAESFCKDSHALVLYERLLNRTTNAHTEAIEKHITSFKTFCAENQESIMKRTPNFSGNITYSPKVFIDMNHIFSIEMDSETSNAIWCHLLTILAILLPESNAKEVLKNKDSIMKFDGECDEEDFLNNIISKVEKHVNTDTTNPQEAIASIMSSGMITDLVSSLNDGLSSGKIDIAKMMGSVQKMVGNISEEAGNDPSTSGAMSMLTNMMGMMGNMKQ